MTAYWQAEIYRNGDLYDVDFPRRETERDALRDCEIALARFSDDELGAIFAQAAEYEHTDDGTVKSTGKTVMHS